MPSVRLLLLRRLSEESPDWAVWKNVDRMLKGAGDVDTLAPASSWLEISNVFEDWAFSNGFTGVVSCRHVPGVLLLMAISPDEPTLSELDVCDECYWRGTLLFTAAQVAPLIVQDPRGFRCLRPGAQGLFLLLLNGVQRSGRQDVQAIKDKQVMELLESDPEGARGAARTLGLGRGAANRLASALRDGGWNRGAALWLELQALVGAVMSPRRIVARVRFRMGPFRTCPVIAATKGGRTTPNDIEGWLETVANRHPVVRT
jgi:hypothetical protein